MTDDELNAEALLSLDFENVDFFRGDTPSDIREKCLKLCADYLNGVWLQVSPENVEVRRLTGGLTNQLYYCAIPSDLQPIEDEPREVAIRFYGGKHFNTTICDGDERLSDVIIALLASNRDLGPKIYGVFQNGQIQKYYKHSQFRKENQENAELVKELAQKLAKVHALNVPIKRSKNWLYEMYDDYLRKAYEMWPIDQMIDECKCETMKSNSIGEEKEWLRSLMDSVNSPIVFAHNDFRGSNIMVKEDKKKGSNIVLCDFEYSSYTFRGFDFGTIFAEWGRNFNEYKDLHNFPDDSVLLPFINEYREESSRAYGPDYLLDASNSVEQLLREIKIFVLVANMMMILFLMCVESMDDMNVADLKISKKTQIIFAEVIYKSYLHLKSKFLDDGTITKVCTRL